MSIEEIRKLLAERRTEMKGLLEAAQTEKRSLTAEEATRFDELEAEITARSVELRRLEVAETEERKAEEERQAEAARQAKAAEARTKFGLGDGTGSIRVGAEEHTYRKGGPHQYFQDLAASGTMGQSPAYYGAVQRLARHAQEMEIDARDNPTSASARALRDVEHFAKIESRSADGGTQERTGLTTAVGSGGTFLPPAYLLDDFIVYPRQNRVMADLVRKQDLPRGPMTIEIPKITAPTLVNSQVTQNTAITEQDLTDAYVSAPVVTVAGEQTVSLQAIEQSAVPYDEIVFSDLQMARELNIELQVVNGSGSNNQMTGILNTSSIGVVTYTSASPTATAAWPYFGAAKAKVFDAIFRPADFILMYPDRWEWFATAQDNNLRPLVVPNAQGPWNTMGTEGAGLNNGPRPVGTLAGVPVYVSAVIPTNLGSGTNQDEIVVGSSKDLMLWESAPVARALPQTLGNTLSVLLQVYEYAAFMPNRYPGALCTISGTGFTTPTF